jgi:hypothetical protein
MLPTERMTLVYAAIEAAIEAEREAARKEDLDRRLYETVLSLDEDTANPNAAYLHNIGMTTADLLTACIFRLTETLAVLPADLMDGQPIQPTPSYRLQMALDDDLLGEALNRFITAARAVEIYRAPEASGSDDRKYEKNAIVAALPPFDYIRLSSLMASDVVLWLYGRWFNNGDNIRSELLFYRDRPTTLYEGLDKMPLLTDRDRAAARDSIEAAAEW